MFTVDLTGGRKIVVSFSHLYKNSVQVKESCCNILYYEGENLVGNVKGKVHRHFSDSNDLVQARYYSFKKAMRFLHESFPDEITKEEREKIWEKYFNTVRNPVKINWESKSKVFEPF